MSDHTLYSASSTPIEQDLDTPAAMYFAQRRTCVSGQESGAGADQEGPGAGYELGTAMGMVREAS